MLFGAPSGGPFEAPRCSPDRAGAFHFTEKGAQDATRGLLIAGKQQTILSPASRQLRGVAKRCTAIAEEWALTVVPRRVGMDL